MPPFYNKKNGTLPFYNKKTKNNLAQYMVFNKPPQTKNLEFTS